MSEPFIAEVRIWGLNFAPRGWAMCDGQLLAIAQNTALFSLIGTTYGGDGRTTMGLPNLKDRMPMGQGTGPGLPPSPLGSQMGVPNVSLNTNQIPRHTHQLKANAAGGNLDDPTNEEIAGAAIYNTALGSPEGMAAATIPSYGQSQAHENRSPYLNLTFTIALQGLFPSRS